MTETPLDIAPGDIVHLDLAFPLKYDDGRGGIDERDLIRVRVESVSETGLTCSGSYLEPGPIVPTATREVQYLQQGSLEFFPWSSIVRMTKLFTFAEYEEAWDGRR